jgi:hypothetical protein
MSLSGVKADIVRMRLNVRLLPKADIAIVVKMRGWSMQRPGPAWDYTVSRNIYFGGAS